MHRRPLSSLPLVVAILAVASAASAQSSAPPTDMPPEAKGATPSPGAASPDAAPSATTASGTTVTSSTSLTTDGTAAATTTTTITEGTPSDENALAGWHGGLFFLRDRDDNFRLYIQGRAQIDSYNYFGPGVSDGGLKSTIFLRRVRPELTGEFLGKFQWMLAGDWGASSVDNARGTGETSAAAPGKAPDATTGRYNSAQTPRIVAVATDVYLNYKADSLFNVQVGQYDAPFTMENRTSDKYFAFMERSLAVRALGVPTNKEIGAMFWGETKDKMFFYSAGVFNGDGQNRPNPDNRADLIGRVFFHPLASMKNGLKDLQIGGSFRFGERDPNYVNYDYNAFTTQANYTFWSPIYNGSKGFTHVLPAGKQVGYAFELRVPVEDKFDLQGEFVGINNGTREAVEGFQATNSERFGKMSGYSYYVQLGFWPMGNRDINGAPGYENPSHVDLKKPDKKTPSQAVQILVKWEQFAAKYESNSRSGDVDAKGIDGKIKVNALSLGVNYWASKHVRLTANYIMNMFPDSAPTKPTAAGGPAWSADQRALAPGNALPVGINDSARDSAHVLHELTFRAAVAF